MLEEGTPIFLQIAEQLSADIVDGTLAEGGRVPSTNEFAAFYRINPATAAKGINMLVDDGILEKRRGIGMFVVAGARDRLIQMRRKEFAEQYVDPLLAEARRLGIETDELIALIRHPGQRHQPRPINRFHKKARRHDTDRGGRTRHPPLPRDDGTGRRFHRAAGEHHHRAAGPQRRRQVHADADHHRPGVPELRDGSGGRAGIRWRTTPSCAG